MLNARSKAAILNPSLPFESSGSAPNMDQVHFLESANVATVFDNALPHTLGELSATAKDVLKRQAGVLLASHKSCPQDKFRGSVKLFLEGGILTEESALRITPRTQNRHAKSATKGRLNDVQRLMQLYNVHPKIEDYSNEPISLIDKIKIPGPEYIPDALRELVERKILLKEEEATHMANEFSEKYGSESLFRSAFREFFSTGLIGVQQTFWRPDPRSQRIRRQAEEICLQAIDESLWLNGAEILFVIRATRCFPEDAMSFWRWVSANRLTYLAVMDMIELQGGFLDDPETVQSQWWGVPVLIFRYFLRLTSNFEEYRTSQVDVA
ncbi:hypothetical protein BDBG_06645 [Blastomyces gilchristii SLH14081]|uniref:Uncharacterized protein n=2 Tax=Blastomyces gilchristii (strain SLH14081) TaxID=559298 RepID=A0A179UUF1_BLAGS|nr:uncharacterized protein BDBG_06645 [Blastomyces gilchristii SLH14081]OAT10859.1 hypothetical protein BDBG_06645 [Blastomyces gilchristii SLH14081]